MVEYLVTLSLFRMFFRMFFYEMKSSCLRSSLPVNDLTGSSEVLNDLRVVGTSWPGQGSQVDTLIIYIDIYIYS